VTAHRGKRSRRTIRTALVDVPGIGAATAKKLLRVFGSLDGVKGASEEALVEAAGKKAAAAIRAHFTVVR
jgi:excinuclease ABC subunit C